MTGLSKRELEPQHEAWTCKELYLVSGLVEILHFYTSGRKIFEFCWVPGSSEDTRMKINRRWTALWRRSARQGASYKPRALVIQADDVLHTGSQVYYITNFIKSLDMISHLLTYYEQFSENYIAHRKPKMQTLWVYGRRVIVKTVVIANS